MTFRARVIRLVKRLLRVGRTGDSFFARGRGTSVTNPWAARGEFESQAGNTHY